MYEEVRNISECSTTVVVGVVRYDRLPFFFLIIAGSASIRQKPSRPSPNPRDLCRTLEILLRASAPPPRSVQSLHSPPQRGPRLVPRLDRDVEAALRPYAKLFGFATNSSGSVTSRPVRSTALPVRSIFNRTDYKKKGTRSSPNPCTLPGLC